MDPRSLVETRNAEIKAEREATQRKMATPGAKPGQGLNGKVDEYRAVEHMMTIRGSRKRRQMGKAKGGSPSTHADRERSKPEAKGKQDGEITLVLR